MNKEKRVEIIRLHKEGKNRKQISGILSICISQVANVVIDYKNKMINEEGDYHHNFSDARMKAVTDPEIIRKWQKEEANEDNSC